MPTNSERLESIRRMLDADAGAKAGYTPELYEEVIRFLLDSLTTAREEAEKSNQVLGWILDAADAAYIEDGNNTRIHEIFNIVAKAAGITRRLPDENSPFEL